MITTSNGIGEDLLVYIMEQAVQAATEYAIDALVLTPLDKEAEQWYLKRDFGFAVTYIPDRALILSVETMRTVLGGSSTE